MIITYVEIEIKVQIYLLHIFLLILVLVVIPSLHFRVMAFRSSFCVWI